MKTPKPLNYLERMGVIRTPDRLITNHIGGLQLINFMIILIWSPLLNVTTKHNEAQLNHAKVMQGLSLDPTK